MNCIMLHNNSLFRGKKSNLDIDGVPLNIACWILFLNLGVVYILDRRSCCQSVDTKEAASNADESR